MASPASQEFVNRVRSAIDIVDLVGEYVQLKKSGRTLMGLCPFHSEKTPSFHVNAQRQFFHCFGCGAGGDVFSFLMQMEQLTFPEALSKLAERAGLPLPRSHAGQHEQSREQMEKQVMVEAYRLVTKIYHHILTSTPHGSEAMMYLRSRGLTDETIDQFQLGFAPPSWDYITQTLKNRGFSLPLMAKAGLIAASENGERFFDRFRGRVMFPIHDSQGEVIGFGGRSLDGSHPKYVNSPETPLFSKGFHLFNLHRARTAMRKRKQVLLLEGYVDVISVWQAGFHHAVATLGTALTEQQARLIRRNAEQVIVCYDGDNAGQEATEKAIDVLKKAGCSVRVAALPAGVDPDEYIRREGAESFSQNILLQAMPVTAFRLSHLRSKMAVRDELDQARYIQAALEIVCELESAVERDLYERQLAQEFSLSLDAVKAESRRVYKQQKILKQRDKVTPAWNNSINNGKFTLTRSGGFVPAHQNAERMLLYYMMRSQEVADRVKEECFDDFSLDEHCALAAYLFAYYAEGNEPDPGNFIHYVEDETSKQLASGLAMMECNEDISDQAIDDYIRQLKNHRKRMELESLREKLRDLMSLRAVAEDEEQRNELTNQAKMIGSQICEWENALKQG